MYTAWAAVSTAYRQRSALDAIRRGLTAKNASLSLMNPHTPRSPGVGAGGGEEGGRNHQKHVVVSTGDTRVAQDQDDLAS